MNIWKIIIFFGIIIPTHDFLILENVNILNNDKESDEGSTINDDDDEDPFTLFHRFQTEKNFTKQETDLNILLHAHLVKILWNKVKSEKTLLKSIDSKVYPVDLKFSIQLTEEIVNTIETYLNKSEESIGSKFNNYMLNYLKVESLKVKAEPPIFNEFVQPWYETKFFLISVVGTLIMSFFLMNKKNFFFLILFVGLVHKGLERFEEAELQKSITFSKQIPDHCVDNNTSIWNTIRQMLNWNRKGECIQYYKDLHTKTHHSANVLKIIPAVISDIFEGLFSSFGDIIGKIYQGLDKYMPWYLTPFFLIVLILAPMWFIMVFAYKSIPGLIFRNNKRRLSANQYELLKEDQKNNSNTRHPRRFQIWRSSYRNRSIRRK